MSVYDSAYALAKAIKESGEVQEMESALAAVNEDSESKRLLADFRACQAGLQAKLMKGEEMSADEMESIEQQYDLIGEHPLIRRVFEAERRIAVMAEDVQRIIGEPLSRFFQETES